MNLIPYEEFTINENILKKLNEYYVSKKINEYFMQNGQLPDSGTVETYIIPEKLMDRYKKHFYAEYYRKEVEFEKEYGPSEMIETSFDFSTIEDNDSTLLGAKSPMLLGASTSGDDTEYQYEYWYIAIKIKDGNDNRGWTVGTFTSLKDVTVKLYSLAKYTIYVYHRKSNHLYDRIIDSHGLNMFYEYSPIYYKSPISEYAADCTYQNEDKEYIGVVWEYVPTHGGVINGNVYTLNPRMILNVSGLTDGIVCRCGSSVAVMRDSGGTISYSGTVSDFIQTSESSFSCVLQKDNLIHSLHIFGTYEGGVSTLNDMYNRISEKDCAIPQYWAIHCFTDNEERATVGVISSVPRNDTITLDVVIPPIGTNIDTGFEFDIVDD